MRKIKIVANDGQVFTGRLPASWAEVPFGAYLDLRAAARPVPACIPEPTVHAFAHEAGCQAVARFLGLPDGEPLRQNVRRLLPIYEAAPWLFGTLQPAGPVAVAFTHQGTRYRYAPDAELGPEAAAGRRHTLLWFLREADGNLITCSTNLLATLYTPEGSPPTLANGQAGAAALDTLPMSLAWPTLLQFVVPDSLAPPIQRYLALRPMLAQALQAMEAAASAAPRPRRGLLAWLAAVGRPRRSPPAC